MPSARPAITVATTLLNRPRVTRPAVYTRPSQPRPSQDYGLIGPARPAWAAAGRTPSGYPYALTAAS
jgi:hypothetical protein